MNDTRLTIERLQELLEHGILKPGGIFYVPDNFKAYPEIMDLLSISGTMARQLLATMQREAKLREALKGAWQVINELSPAHVSQDIRVFKIEAAIKEHPSE